MISPASAAQWMLSELKFQLAGCRPHSTFAHSSEELDAHMRQGSLCFTLHPSPFNIPHLFPRCFFPLLLSCKFHPSSLHGPPSFSATSTGSFAWEDRLMWAILPNRSYMSPPWWNWFSTPTAFPLLCNLPLPYGSHLYFMLPPFLLEINGRGEVRLRGLQFDMFHHACACIYIWSLCMCVLWGERVSRLSAGLAGEKVRAVLSMSHSLLAVGLFWYRGLSPALPWRYANSSKQLTKQLERVMKLISLNVSFSTCCSR